MPAISTNMAANSAVSYLNINSQQETSALEANGVHAVAARLAFGDDAREGRHTDRPHW